MRRHTGAASSRRTTVDGLPGALVELVEQDITRIRGSTRTAVRKAGKAVEDEIRASGAYSDRTGRYRAGWTTTVEGNAPRFGEVAENTELAHLLENGHGGPRPAGPHPHIAPAYERGVKVLEEELRRAVGG